MHDNLSSEQLTTAQLGEVELLVRSHRFARHRGYERLGEDLVPAERARVVASFREAVQGVGGLALSVRDGHEVMGAALLRPREFDADHFGLPVHQLSDVVSVPEPHRRRAAVAGLCALALDLADGLVLLDVDAEDVHALAGAQEAGLRVYDTKLTYVTRRPVEIPAGGDPSITVRCYDRSNPPDLPPDQVDRMARDSAAAFRESHFHADPLLPDDRCDALYDTWARNVLNGEWAHWWVIAFDDQGPQGCVGLRYSSLFGADHEPSIIGDPFGFATHPRGAGVGTAMLHTFTRDAPGDFVEDQTQVRTTPLLIAIPRVGRFLRSNYVLHGWSPRAAERQASAVR